MLEPCKWPGLPPDSTTTLPKETDEGDSKALSIILELESNKLILYDGPNNKNKTISIQGNYFFV